MEPPLPELIPNVLPRQGEHIHLRLCQSHTVDLAWCGLRLSHGMCARSPQEIPAREQGYLCERCLRFYRPGVLVEEQEQEGVV